MTITSCGVFTVLKHSVHNWHNYIQVLVSFELSYTSLLPQGPLHLTIEWIFPHQNSQCRTWSLRRNNATGCRGRAHGLGQDVCVGFWCVVRCRNTAASFIYLQAKWSFNVPPHIWPIMSRAFWEPSNMRWSVSSRGLGLLCYEFDMLNMLDMDEK